MKPFGMTDHINQLLGLQRAIRDAQLSRISNLAVPDGVQQLMRTVKRTMAAATVMENVKQITSVPIVQLIPSLDGIKESVERSNKEIKNFSEILLRAGYPPTLSVDIREGRELGSAFGEYLEKDSETLEVLVSKVDYMMTEKLFRPQVIDMLKHSWERSSALKGRTQLTRQALTAHNWGLYALTVPSLLTQLEGVVAQSFDHKEKLNTSQLKLLVNNLFSDDKNWLDFEKNAKKFYLDQILNGDFRHGEQTRYETNRHAIAHGAALPDFFAKKEVSLKIILMLDAILHGVDNLEEADIHKAKQKLKVLNRIKRIKKGRESKIGNFAVRRTKIAGFYAINESGIVVCQGEDYEVADYLFNKG